MNNGLITDWDAMEQMWCHIFYEELLTPPENFNILHTESLLNSMQCREKLIEVNVMHISTLIILSVYWPSTYC